MVFIIKGAAYATVIGQIVSFLLALIFHLRADKRVENKAKYIKPSASVIGGIYSIGFAAIIAQALMSVMTYGMNITLGRQLVFVFPFALIFADMAKKDASAVWTVWLTFIIAEVISAVIAVLLFVRLYRKKVVNS